MAVKLGGDLSATKGCRSLRNSLQLGKPHSHYRPPSLFHKAHLNKFRNRHLQVSVVGIKLSQNGFHIRSPANLEGL